MPRSNVPPPVTTPVLATLAFEKSKVDDGRISKVPALVQRDGVAQHTIPRTRTSCDAGTIQTPSLAVTTEPPLIENVPVPDCVAVPWTVSLPCPAPVVPSSSFAPDPSSVSFVAWAIVGDAVTVPCDHSRVPVPLNVTFFPFSVALFSCSLPPDPRTIVPDAAICAPLVN